jgi:hypothetical protein
MRPELLVYGLGRLAFGVGLLAAPVPVGRLLIGDEAEEPAVRVALRTYGTRDVVLGLGTLRSADSDEVGAWIAAGIAADVLDTAVQLVEWKDIPPQKRAPGVAAALGAAAAGIALLVAERQRS